MSETSWPTDATDLLPDDGYAGTLVGRAWVPAVGGPSVVAIRESGVVDVSATFPTMRALTESADPAAAVAAATGPVIGSLDDLVIDTPPEQRRDDRPWLLSPIDLHVVKAAGTHARPTSVPA